MNVFGKLNANELSLHFYITLMPPKHLALAILPFAFIACSDDNTITYGGKTYKTVKIGEQTWMAENLNYEAEGSVCYENNPAKCAKDGRLYYWDTAKKVCPDGWHLPSNAEWDKLLRFVYGDVSSWGNDDYGIWWSAGEYEYYSYNAYGWSMHYYGDDLNWNNYDTSGLFSVRCVKD